MTLVTLYDPPPMALEELAGRYRDFAIYIIHIVASVLFYGILVFIVRQSNSRRTRDDKDDSETG